MIYLDNAATSYPKPKAVLRRVSEYIKNGCGNPGRSSHRLALRAAEEVYIAREAVAELFSLSNPERVVFTSNATHALNLALKTLLREPCHVLISDQEHNSVVRPLERLGREIGIRYSCFSLYGDLYENLAEAMQRDTEAVVCTLASNVTGKRCDLAALCRFCSEKKLKLVLDASQLAGHERIDLVRNPCTVLCAPGHKALFGLQGSGFAIFCDDELRESFMEGGSGSDSLSRDMPRLLPERYEAGTLATPSIVSLRAGIEFINDYGTEQIGRRLDFLMQRARDALLEMREIKLHSAESGIISFTAEGLSPSEMGSELDSLGICVRAGLHCAPSAHSVLGTLESGTVRVSFSALNKDSDADRLTDGVNKILKSRR